MSLLKNNMHPGEFLLHAYIEPLGISLTEISKKLGVSVSSLSRLVNKKSDMSYEMAIRLSCVIGRSAESWMTLQSNYSLELCRKNIDLTNITPYLKSEDSCR